MKLELPDIDIFERSVFKKKDALNLLLSFSLDLLQARHVGLLFGTNHSFLKFLPPEKWDRGVMHKFDGKGLTGFVLKCFGTVIIKKKKLSPVFIYQNTQSGEKKDSDGIIAFVLRTHKEFYEKGLKVLIIDCSSDSNQKFEDNSWFSVYSYNGKEIKRLPALKINIDIVKQFNAKNFVSAYVPDYGCIVFNTISEDLIVKHEDGFVHEDHLKKILDLLISAIQMASIAHIGSARGRQAAHMIWRKETHLRKTALELKHTGIQLNAQKEYLKSVGAVDEEQLHMDAVNITDGVYAFMDMSGSAILRKQLSPADYFYVLNICHQIAADSANRFSCRVDNFIGDSVFLLNASPFDSAHEILKIKVQERLMLMIFTIASIFNEIRLLKIGKHPMDKECRVKKLIDMARIDLGYRAGMDIGSAMIGPIGSQKRKIVTAIGKAVNHASRLESTGICGEIHTSKEVVSLIRNFPITQETQRIWKTLVNSNMIGKSEDIGRGTFFDYYRQFFNLQGEITYERRNIAYKEFTKDISFMIRCLPE